MRTKQEFKALRESVGMTQAELASLLKVRERSIRRWESQDVPQTPPDDAWGILDEAMAYQVQTITEQLQKAQESTTGVSTVQVPYWMSEDDYEAHPSEDFTTYREANASIRAFSSVLRSHGTEVEYISASDWLEHYR